MIFLEKYVLPILAAITVGVLIINPLKFDLRQRFSLGITVIAFAFFISHSLERSRTDDSDEVVEAPSVPSSTPVPAQPRGRRSYTDKTVRDLLKLYDGKTMLQADSLMEPFKGEWIRVTARVLQLIPDPSGVTAVLESEPTDIVNARFDKRWEMPLRRLSTGDLIKIRGKISVTQNGQQLYLQECELLK